MLQASNLLRARYTNNRFIRSVDDWPPHRPKHYTPLTIVHHEQMRTESEVEVVAQEMSARDIWTGTRGSEIYSRAINNINDLFVPYENENYENTSCGASFMVLIEGAPGIGKTELSKEIALQWAKNSILKEKKLLFLLALRDPYVKQIKNIRSFVYYFFQSDALSNKITDWLVKTDGKHFVIIIDGYDEVAMDDDSYFINDSIITRKVLTQCGIVIASRPVASSCLHDVVNCRAEVLGFTEKDRQDFIHTAFQNESDKIEELNEYLLANQQLNLLCYVPLIMSILLCLAKEGIDALPKTQTALYKKFILMTINHFLKLKLHLTTPITQFVDLPNPYDQSFMELSYFAFLALVKNQLVFTLAEVKAEYPNLTPANWYGLGLLNRAQYFKPQDGCDHESFHFLHYSIQEYMAAYYITSLRSKKLLSLLEKTFWNVHYFNTWVMYVGITGGRKRTFTHFLSGNSFKVTSRLSIPKSISNKILSNKIKCLHLLHCSAEADCEILSSIGKMFDGQMFDLSNTNLSINDLRTLVVLLLRSPDKEWEMLNLSRCNIDDHGCNELCKMFLSQRIKLKIKKVDISHNKIQWESLSGLCKLWHTEELVISIDALYDSTTMDAINSFTNMLHKNFHKYFIGRLFSSMLLCTYMAEQQTMIVVYSEPNECIKCYQLTGCKLTDGTVTKLKNLIAEEIELFTIRQIVFSYNISYSEATMKSTMLADYIERVTFCGTSMHSKGAYLMNIPMTIQCYDNPHHIGADYLAATLCQSIQNKSYQKAVPSSLAIDINNTLQHIPRPKIFYVKSISISKEAADGIAAVLFHNTDIQKLHLGDNNLNSAGAIKIAKGLQNTVKLTVLNLSNNNISEEAADDIAAVLSRNTNLQKLYLHYNNLKSAGATKIAKGLQNTVKLTVFDLNNNNISEEAVDDIAAVLSHNINLQELYLSDNNLKSAGATKIAKGLQNTVKLTVFGLSNNNISEEAADDIAAVLSHNTNLQKLYLHYNNLKSAGATKIAKGLQNTVKLTVFDLKNSNVSEEAADDIAAVLSHNINLQKLYLSDNNLKSAGATKIAKGLRNTVKLTVFDLNNNNISEEAVDDIAAVLSHNINLQKLYLSDNNLKSAGATKIAKGLQNTVKLTVFGLNNNNISEEAADDIAGILSHNTNLQELYLSGNNLKSAGATKIAKGLQNTVKLTVFGLSNNNISEESADDIAAVLSHNINLQKLYLSYNNLKSAGATKIAKGLQNTVKLTVFDLNNNNISEEAADDIAGILIHNINLQELYLSGNNLKSAGATKIAKGLQNTVKLTAFDLDNNNISEEAADDIAVVLSHNINLQKLYLSDNNLKSAGATKIAKGLQSIVKLTVFGLSSNNISEEAADDIAAVLSHNTNLQELYLSDNNLKSAGATKITKGLQNTVKLTVFGLSKNNISKEAADDIAAVLSHNINLQKLYLHYNNLKSAGATKIAKGLQNTVKLTVFGLNNNNISEEAADDIAGILSHNTNLQELYLSGNNLKSAGATKIAKGLQNTVKLTVFGLSNNNISEEAADDIAAVLSHNINLQKLYLRYNSLKSAGAIKIAKGLQNTVKLTVFDLNNNNISEEAADDIAGILTHNTNLQELYLSDNNLKSAGATKLPQRLTEHCEINFVWFKQQ